MNQRCSLRLDLVQEDARPAWQVFDRLTGANGGMVRSLPLSHTVDPGQFIISFKHDIIDTLNDSGHAISVATLRAWGRTVCAAIFPNEIRRKLSAYEGGDLLFMVPLPWADLPFELLCLPNGFLGERFQIGTIIRSGTTFGPEKGHNHEGAMVIIADPSEILQSAGREGELLKNIAIRRRRPVRLMMHADRQKLFTEMPGASIVHFAGHSGPDWEYDHVGWKLGDGEYFNTDDILKISAGSLLPWLVFSNSCDGGRIVVNAGLSGIAGAFLSAGVHQVIGPFCKLNDQQAGHATISFYRYLFQGKSAAEALRSLRKKRPDGAGVTPFFYRLFGDPRFQECTRKKVRGNVVPLLVAVAVILLLAVTGGRRLLHTTEARGATAAAGTIDRRSEQHSGEVAVDLTIGGIIRFSVNLYSPTFTFNGHRSQPETEEKSDTVQQKNPVRGTGSE